jgi:glyceraldehyde-3-phosphate dehydrogenase (NAD(P))
MAMTKEKICVALNGYGVIGKRVADAIECQDDMELTGVADISTDWRTRIADQKGLKIFAANFESLAAMRLAGLAVIGTLDELLGNSDIIVDCTPKRTGAKNAQYYADRGGSQIHHPRRRKARSDRTLVCG